MITKQHQESQWYEKADAHYTVIPVLVLLRTSSSIAPFSHNTMV